MSHITENQPDGTPTWIDLGIPDVDRAMEFYGAVFGWDFEVVMPEMGRYTICRLDGRSVAALAESGSESTSYWWQVYFATSDCDATAKRITEAGGELVIPSGHHARQWPDRRREGPRRIAVRPLAGRGQRRCRDGERARIAAAQRPGDTGPGAGAGVLRDCLRLHE